MRIRVFKKAVWTVGRFDKQFLESYAEGGPLPSIHSKHKQGLQHQHLISQCSNMSKLELQNDSEFSYYAQVMKLLANAQSFLFILLYIKASISSLAGSCSSLDSHFFNMPLKLPLQHETSPSAPSCVDSQPHGYFSNNHPESNQRFKPPRGVASRVEEQPIRDFSYQGPYQPGFNDNVSGGMPLIHSLGPVWTGDEDVKKRLSTQRSQSRPIQIGGRRQVTARISFLVLPEF